MQTAIHGRHLASASRSTSIASKQQHQAGGRPSRQQAAPGSLSAAAAAAASTSGREHTQQNDHHSSSRRQLLLAAVSTLPALGGAAQVSPAQAAAAADGSCQLQESSTGLQWCDITVGEGQLPIKSAFTKLNYTAKLASTGAVFDSTYQRKQPLIFKVGECEMVQAFDVAVLGAQDIPPMREGGKRLVVAPPGPMQRQGVKSLTWVANLLDAIDEAGEPRTPEGGFNSTLVFEVELVPKRRG